MWKHCSESDVSVSGTQLCWSCICPTPLKASSWVSLQHWQRKETSLQWRAADQDSKKAEHGGSQQQLDDAGDSAKQMFWQHTENRWMAETPKLNTDREETQFQ